MSALAVILPLVFATAPAAAGPSPAEELADFRQAEAFRAANESRESSAIAGVVGEDETLMQALAGTLLNPAAAGGVFEADGDGYVYRLKVDWNPTGKLIDIIAPLSSALGNARTGDVLCFGSADGSTSRLVVSPNMTDSVLEQLGISPGAIASQDRILGEIGDESVSLSTQSMGAILFAAVLTELEGSTRGKDLELTLYEPVPLVAGGPDDILRLTTKNDRVIELPIEIIGDVAKLDQDAVSKARWRITGTDREIPLDLGKPIQRSLLATALKTGRASLSQLRTTKMYPVSTTRVSLPEHEVHLLGPRNAWYGEERFEGTAIAAAKRTPGECAVAVNFKAPSVEVALGPLPASVWPEVTTFRMNDPAEQSVQLAYLDPPSEGRDPGGISNADFDDLLTREGRCEAYCSEFIGKVAATSLLNEYLYAKELTPERCESACAVSRPYADCLIEALEASNFPEKADMCEARNPLAK